LVSSSIPAGLTQNEHLAQLHAEYLNDKMAANFNSLTDRLRKYPHQKIRKSIAVDRTFQAAQDRREVTHAIKAIIPRDTLSYVNVEVSETRALEAARAFINYAQTLKAEVDYKLIEKFFSTESAKLLSPEEAYQQVITIHNLDDLEKPPKPIAGDTLFVPNYPDSPKDYHEAAADYGTPTYPEPPEDAYL